MSYLEQIYILNLTLPTVLQLPSHPDRVSGHKYTFRNKDCQNFSKGPQLLRTRQPERIDLKEG
jgi:hypothetical protein